MTRLQRPWLAVMDGTFRLPVPPARAGVHPAWLTRVLLRAQAGVMDERLR
jgi:hypothetical protein